MSRNALFVVAIVMLSACGSAPTTAARTPPVEAEDDDNGAAPLGPRDHVERVPTRAGVTVPVLTVAPEGAPSAVAVLFPGGDGALHLSGAGIGRGADNFMVRTRARFASAGIAAVVVDAPSDHEDGVGDYRVHAHEAEDVARVVAWARARWSAPVWLVGTSRGTLSAANAVARGVDVRGLVLTASITAGKKATLYDVPLRDIGVPVLLAHHTHDGCPASPVDGLARLQRSFTRARSISVRVFDGGEPARSRACGPLSPHGFVGLDAEVVASIVEFIRAS